MLYIVQCIVNGENAPSSWDFVVLPEEGRATAIGNTHRKIGEDRACGSEDILADRDTDRQTHTHIHTQTCSSRYFATASAGEVINKLRDKLDGWQLSGRIATTAACRALSIRNCTVIRGIFSIAKNYREAQPPNDKCCR